MENKNRSIKMNENFKPALTSGSKEPLVSSNVTLPSTHVPGKSVAFTKISKKNRATAQGKTKPETIKKKESPLLLAFQNQENAVKNKNVDVVTTRSKKEKAKTTSIVDLMGKQTKQVEDIPTKKQSGKLKKGKKSSGVSNKIENYVDKKRSREGEEQDGKPSGKKAKLVNNAPEFKKPRKGQKRKARSMESKENGNTVETQGSNSDPLGKSPKCRKISSDDDFIKPSTRSSRPKVDTNNDATDDCGTGKQSLRKSRRLQEKKDDLADTRIALVETDDKRAENAVIEVLEVKEDCSKQDGKVQAHENDIKVVEGEPSKVVEATTEPTSEVVEATTKPKSEVVEATTKPKSEVVEATTKPTSEVVEATTKPTSEVVEATTKPTSEVVEATTKNMNEDSDVSSSAVLWSECFKPRNSTEILGNTNAGGKLRNWLFEWKTLREKRLEALKRHKEKKHQKLAAKKGKKETSSWWQDDDDDSDFYSSDDNEDENFDDEDILCNTMLLSGPVGSGKTSSIYACAEELGFKVIEVNSSTKRGGKYILSELLEATQSHQVSTKRGMQTELFPRAAPYEEKKKEQMKGNKKKKGQSKKKEQLSDETQLQGPMSLILLDEVDILFEEDKGFWVSVNTLRQNSKRPIVMTASDLTAIDIDGEYEHIILKSPSLKLYAAYFQTVCLTKDVFVNPSDVRALSWLNHADIRRLLLNLQFWIDSAAGACDKRGITIRNDIGTSAGILSKNDVEYGQANTTQLNAGNAIEMDSTVRTQEECDGKVLSVNANVDNDTASSCSPIEVESRLDKKGSIQNSNDEMLALDKMEKLQSLSKKKIDSTKKFDVINDNKDCERGENDELGKMKKHDTISSQKAPIEMHNLCLESMLGIRNIDNNVGNVFETLKSDLKTKVSFRQKCLVTSHCQSMNMDILYCNLETILPCVFSSINKARDNPLNPKPGDDNGHSFDTENGAESPKDENDVVNDGIEDDASHATVSDEDILSKKLDGISLTCLGNFYEVMSFMDAELYRYEPGTSEEIFGAWSARISPGLSDSAGKHTASQTPWKTTNLQNELRGALEVASLEHSRRKFHNLCSRNGEQMMRYANKLMSQPCTTLSCSSDIKNIDSRISPNCCDEMVADSTNAFSDLDGERCLQVTTLSENLVSKTRKQEQDFSSVSSYLPEMNCLNRRVIVMDYRPALHNICKDESLRKAARIKRRFYHYFDSIGLHIPSSVIQSLTEDSYFS
ncbi:ATPase family AAA domain-containing protein 5-like [Dendronephthya gigantea]|uniref:ATPase family AAA domain-containing protein 5-like n=1 Tax=Dendronephthya gigantea TaxID=151771 RepID=UPI0010696C38|nr:ATPase family AAA domain-containing protein 5-like [Dendronephthya gigantea]